jgi:hypothetical protein
VNSPEQMIFGVIEGLKGIYMDSKDHIGLPNIANEIIKHVPLNKKGNLPKSLRTETDIGHAILVALSTPAVTPVRTVAMAKQSL